MRVIETSLPGVLILEPKLHRDVRGYFLESWNAAAFTEVTGVDLPFVQDNLSHSVRGVLRGIHYQLAKPQGKLVTVLAGEVLDVAVDLRRSSPMFGRWTAVVLNAENRYRLWIAPGFGHGFVTRSESADVLYKTTDYWYPQHERSIVWNDPSLGIDWGMSSFPLLSDKDASASPLSAAEVYD
jgi:dTDP-4-dehydrorhamnose 3,5-epimerase